MLNTTAYSYVIEHDVGFAPNPFHGICSLANCKPRIRQKAEIGDLILGFGSAKHGYAGLLVYWMRVEKVITFNEYWNSAEYAAKRPIINGSLINFYGDNIYFTCPNGIIKQLYSFHSNEDGTLSEGNLKRDTGRTNRVLLSNDFTYYGREAIELPKELELFVKRGIGEKHRFSKESVAELSGWIKRIGPLGFMGTPIDWEPVKKNGV